MDITSLIRLAESRKASDLHLAVANPPFLRINGELVPIEGNASLTASDVEQLFEQLTTEKERDTYRDTMELDFGYTFPDICRCRCNAARQRGTISLSMRLIPTIIPSFEELHLPEVCRDLALKPSGLLMVSGPTGSGKSTTLAAMVDYLNHNESRRVVTIEDPMEYVFTNDRSTIIQRELGGDTHSFPQALRHVLRQDPDVIMVGEMRDTETASAALTIAETGHLVLTTGHAPSATQAVERVIDLFPVHERFFAQTRMASLIIAIMCQKLVPTIDGTGRVPAVELMLANNAVRNLIREGKIHQLPNVIRTNYEEGMRVMDQALVELYSKELISGKSLFALCNDRAEVERQIGEVNLKLKAPNEPLPIHSFSA